MQDLGLGYLFIVLKVHFRENCVHSSTDFYFFTPLSKLHNHKIAQSTFHFVQILLQILLSRW